MKKRTIKNVIISFLFCVLMFVSKSAISIENEAVKIKLAKKIINLTEGTIVERRDNISELFSESVQSISKESGYNHCDDFSHETSEFVSSNLSKTYQEKTVDKVAAIYAESFSEDELRAIVNTFEKVSMKKWLETLQKISIETASYAFNNEYIKERRRETKKKVYDIVEKYCRKK